MLVTGNGSMRGAPVAMYKAAPGFFSRDATVPSEMESPMEGTDTRTSAAGAADAWKPRSATACESEGKRVAALLLARHIHQSSMRSSSAQLASQP